MFTVGRAARGAENVGQKKVTKMGDGQLSKGHQKSDIYSLLRLFRSEVKYSFSVRKLGSIIHWEDIMPTLNNLVTQPSLENTT